MKTSPEKPIVVKNVNNPRIAMIDYTVSGYNYTALYGKAVFGRALFGKT